MAFNNLTTLIVAALSISCGAVNASKVPNNDSHSNMVGDPLGFYMPRYMSGMTQSNVVTSFDEHVSRLHQFSLQDGAMLRSIPLPFNAADQQIIASNSGDYFFTIADDRLAMVKASGENLVDPISLNDQIVSSAFDPAANIFIFATRHKNIGIIQATALGDVAASWLGGPLLDGVKTVRAGALISNSRLILTLGENTVAVVATADSLEQKTWVFESFDIPNGKSLLWVAKVPDQDNLVFINDNHERLLLVDVVTKAVVAEQSLNGDSVIGQFRDVNPHIVTISNDISNTKTQIFTVDGNAFKAREFTLPQYSEQIAYSYFDTGRGNITMVANDKAGKGINAYDYAMVYRFRMSDNLLESKNEFKDRETRVGLTPDYIFNQYDSPLGYITWQKYDGKGVVGEMKGFNVGYLGD